MLKIWKWYQNCLSLQPVKTQVISSGFLWGIGDVSAQYITHSTAKKRLQLKVSTFFPFPQETPLFPISFSSSFSPICGYMRFGYVSLNIIYFLFCYFELGIFMLKILCCFLVGYCNLQWWLLFVGIFPFYS